MTEEMRSRVSGRMFRDRSAQVSFSVIAVVLLTATLLTGTVLAKRQLDAMESERRDRLLQDMEREISEVVQELSLYGASCAQQVVSGWDEFPVNETRISDRYSCRVDAYIGSAFPRAVGTSSVTIANWTGGLFYMEKRTYDLISSANSTRTTLSIEGSSMDYDSPAGPSAEAMAETSSNPFYVALGNFSIRVRSGSVSLAKDCSFQRPVISSLPFLESKLRAFEASSDGEMSDLGRMVSYMLTTLGELRVLEGYGQPIYSSGKDSSGILTPEDAYKAVLVGLVLEQARLFRDVDDQFARDVAQTCGDRGPAMLALMSPHARYIDPAELFLWFLGKLEPEMDARMLVSQAFYGLADQVALKLMDYMGWMGLLDASKHLVDSVKETIQSIAAFFTGADKSQISVISWVTKSLKAIGADPSEYKELFSPSVDFALGIPERQYFVEDAQGTLYPVWVGNVTAQVDLPETDLFASTLWGDLYPEFKECQSSLSQMVRDSCTRLAFDLSSVCRIDLPGLVIDPTDDADIFSSLASGVGRANITFDPEAIAESARSLPMFSAQYDLALAFSDFVERKGALLLPQGDLASFALDDIADSILSSVRHSYIPDLVVPVEQQLEEIVRTDVESSSEWGVGAAVRRVTGSLSETVLSKLESYMNTSVTRSDDKFAGPMVDAVARLIAIGADEFPSVGKAIQDVVSGMTRAVLRQEELSSFKQKVYLGVGRPFEFWDGDREAAESSGGVVNESLEVDLIGFPGLQEVPYDESAGYDSLDDLFPTDGLLVQVRNPWDFDRSDEDYPNVHLTSITNLSATPYSSQWVVSVRGLVGLTLSSRGSALDRLLSDGLIESNRSIRIDLSFPVVLHSAWPLHGVEYNPTNTALSDGLELARRFFDKVWDKLEPVIGWVKDGLESVYKFVTDAFEVLAKFANRVLKVLANAMQVLVETLQEYIDKLAQSALGKAVQWFIDLAGRVEFRVSLFGFLIIVQTNLPDLLYRHGSDLLRVIVATKRFGPSLTFGVRIARLTDGSYDILANSTISVKGTSIEVLVDPLMHILRRFAEVHCRGEGWALDLTVPEVEPYELAEVSTSQLPGIGGLLSNIPLPVLGLSASVEAGMRLKYSPPFPTDVVINEFESNPQGEDAGHEWVELYNPLAESRCVDGWTLSTLHGRSAALEIKGTIPANGLLVCTFPEASIDNGLEGDPFNDGDSITLRDASGALMDVTPVLSDCENDGQSWQRSWDGGPRWVFANGGKGASNGAPVVLAASDFIAKALFEAFKEAFEETQLQEVSASLEFLAMFAKRVIHHFIENLLSIVKEIIHEVILYFKVVLSDATGSAGIGFRASFVITGEAIVDLLRWLIYSLATFLVNLGRSSNPIAYPAFPQDFFSGLYLRFELMFEVGLPKMIRLLGAVGDLDDRYACSVAIAPNIPALGKLVGKRWGEWRVEFGVYLEGVPREFVQGFLAVDTGDRVDFWVAKGCVYGT